MTTKELFQSVTRSWRHHFLTQLMTITVLSGTFALITVILLATINIRSVLFKWGEDVQMTVFLNDSLDEPSTQALRARVESIDSFKSVDYVSKQNAKEEFSKRISTYAPELVADPEFQNAFPASFQLKLKSQDMIPKMAEIAGQLTSLVGVSDVSYGQDWVQNYARFATAMNRFGVIISVLLLLASLFIVGNALRMSISQRYDEIEILELIGATPRHIRAPFIFEGIITGTTAAAIAAGITYGLYVIQTSIMSSELPFLDLSNRYQFFSPASVAGLVLMGGMIGYIGSWICLRPVTAGWFASQRKNRHSRGA